MKRNRKRSVISDKGPLNKQSHTSLIINNHHLNERNENLNDFCFVYFFLNNNVNFNEINVFVAYFIICLWCPKGK